MVMRANYFWRCMKLLDDFASFFSNSNLKLQILSDRPMRSFTPSICYVKVRLHNNNKKTNDLEKFLQKKKKTFLFSWVVSVIVRKPGIRQTRGLGHHINSKISEVYLIEQSRNIMCMMFSMGEPPMWFNSAKVLLFVRQLLQYLCRCFARM